MFEKEGPKRYKSIVPRKPMIAVIGASKATDADLKNAEQVGRLIGENGWILINGGLEGVMEASAKGASQAGGLVVGILPTATPDTANPYVEVPIATNLHWARNAIIAQATDVLIAIGGSYGTLSEIGLALTHKKKVIGLATWKIDGVTPVESPALAVELVRVELKQLGF